MVFPPLDADADPLDARMSPRRKSISNLFPRRGKEKKSAKHDVFDDDIVFVRVGALLIPPLERMHSARGTTRKDPFFTPPKAEFSFFFFFFVSSFALVSVVKVVIKILKNNEVFEEREKQKCVYSFST